MRILQHKVGITKAVNSGNQEPPICYRYSNVEMSIPCVSQPLQIASATQPYRCIKLWKPSCTDAQRPATNAPRQALPRVSPASIAEANKSHTWSPDFCGSNQKVRWSHHTSDEGYTAPPMSSHDAFEIANTIWTSSSSTLSLSAILGTSIHYAGTCDLRCPGSIPKPWVDWRLWSCGERGHASVEMLLSFGSSAHASICQMLVLQLVFFPKTDQHHPIRPLKGEFKNHEVILLKIVNTCVMIQMIENKIIASLERGHPLWISRLFDCFKYANGYDCLLSASLPYEYVLSVFMYINQHDKQTFFGYICELSHPSWSIIARNIGFVALLSGQFV